MKIFKKFQWKKINIDEIDDRVLLSNLYITQFFILIVGVLLILFQHEQSFSTLFSPPKQWDVLWWGAGFALLYIVISLSVTRFVPDDVMDDGGINERIFRNRPFWQIVAICSLVALCEEVLFRGAIQFWFGPYWTSIIFAAIHIRYLRHWLMTGMVFGVSYGLGWIYIHTGTLWTPILAHFIIDVVLGCMIRYRRKS